MKRIRDTGDWIAKAFAAIAAVLIGTGPLLVRFSDLSAGPWAVAATIGAATALFGVGLVIYWATQVMLPETTDVAELLNATKGPLKALRERAETPDGRLVHLYRDVGTVRDLVEEFQRTGRTVERLGRFAQQAVVYAAQTPPPAAQTLPPSLRDPAARASIATVYAGEKARLGQLNARLAALMLQGGYEEVRHTFLRARKWMLAGGALAAAGVAVYVAALGVADDAKDAQAGSAAAAPPAAVETLTWNQTSEGARSVIEVRQALGLGGASCNTVPVAVRGGNGSPDAPWQLTTLRNDECAVPPRSFAMDNRYATVSSEPAAKYTLEPAAPPASPWPPLASGLVIGLALAVTTWGFVRDRVQHAAGSDPPSGGE